MAFRTICNCDTCSSEIDVTNGDHPAKVNATAPTPASIGQQQEESHVCAACWEKLCELFPRFREAERFTKPQPVASPIKPFDDVMDTWTLEQVFMAVAKKMGLNVVQTPDPPKPAEDPAKKE